MRHRNWSRRLGAVAAMAALLALPAWAWTQNRMFPSTVGSTWNFVGKAGSQPLIMMAENVKQDREGKKTRVQQRWTLNGRVVQEEIYLVSPTQVERKASGPEARQTLKPPLPVLRMPLSTGKSWTWKGALIENGREVAKGSAVLKVAGRQQVRLRSGPVSAWRIDMKLTVTARSKRAVVENAYWYALGLGLVKQRTVLRPQGKALVVEGTATTVKVK